MVDVIPGKLSSNDRHATGLDRTHTHTHTPFYERVVQTKTDIVNSAGIDTDRPFACLRSVPPTCPCGIYQEG